MDDFLSAIENRPSSVTSWFKTAELQIIRSGRESIFSDMMDFMEKDKERSSEPIYGYL